MIPGGAHLLVAGFPYKVDMSAEDAYTRWSRASLPTGVDDITGNPGDILAEHELRWDITNFKGEGQKIIDITDPESPNIFYTSEGLDFRIPGEFRLNRSTTVQVPVHTGGGTESTLQGNADFADITGTSSTSGTDRQLQAVNDVVGSSDVTPGAGTVQADFYIYGESVQTTTVQGSAMTKYSGSGASSGTDFSLESTGTTVGTSDISGLTAGVVYDCAFYYTLSGSMAGWSSTQRPKIKAQVVDTTNAASSPVVITQSSSITVGTAASSTLLGTLQFTPVSSHTYQLRFVLTAEGAFASQGYALADYVTYGPSLSVARQVKIEVYNTSTPGSVVSQTLNVTATAAGSLIGSLAYDSAAATNYEYRVTYLSGSQRPWVDKVVQTIQTSGSNLQWDPELVDFGMGQNVWLYGYNANDSVTTWTYDWDSTWTNRVTFSSTSGKKPRGSCSTDLYQYVLLDNKIVYQHNTSTANAYISATTADAVGVAVAQNRLGVLGDDSTNGVVLYVYALDQTSYPVSISSTVPISAAKTSPDATLRQRICGAPTGFRFFVNYATRAVVYECDTSPSSHTARVIAVLPAGVKATAIEHSEGKTFIAGQYRAPTGQTARSGLWVLDESGYLREAGLLRKDDSSTSQIQMLRAYQDNLWILQGERVWRWALRTGGYFLEYELPMTTVTNARALAVLEGYNFIATTEALYVNGAVGTYRQSSVDGGSQLVTSIHDFALPGTRKTLWTVEVVTDSIASGGQVVVEYQKDQSGTWTHLGTVTAGTHNSFYPSDGNASVRFNTLQLRITLGSGNGTATPVVKSIIARALPIHDQHFLDARLLLTDEDSLFHVAGRQLKGGDLAAHLWAIKATGDLVTIEDGFMHSDAGLNASYLARIEAIQHSNESPGSGSALVRFRLLAEAV